LLLACVVIGVLVYKGIFTQQQQAEPKKAVVVAKKEKVKLVPSGEPEVMSYKKLK
jgi:hypothetical protein